MLEASVIIEDKKAVINLKGRADTPSSECVYEEFEKGVNKGCTEFEFNLSEVEYICSATLRAFLKAQKYCNKNNIEMYITGASEGVKDVFEITSFSSIINII